MVTWKISAVSKTFFLYSICTELQYSWISCYCKWKCFRNFLYLVKHSKLRKFKKQQDRGNITVLSVSHPHMVFNIFKRLEFQTFPCYCRFPLIKLQINKCASIIIKINHNIFYDFYWAFFFMRKPTNVYIFHSKKSWLLLPYHDAYISEFSLSYFSTQS
jgi:hypothetical protein